MSETADGIVLSIHRASMHDGPGIRTTVFLKGCPLRCAWCHNPESQRARPELAFRAERCIHCGSCVPACPRGAHRLADGRHWVDRDACIGCGACVSACNHEALELYGRRMTVAECLAPVLADRPYYRSGGGLTVSGGEPLAQPAFAAALLSAARARGVHTCLETCGHAGEAALEAVLPYVDLVLFDCKATDEETHRRLTGVGINLISATRERILALGVPMILRCPLVPGVNDDDAHLRAIGALSARHGLPVEIMPFHTLGSGKADALGRPRTGLPEESATQAQIEAWVRGLRAAGVAEVSVG